MRANQAAAQDAQLRTQVSMQQREKTERYGLDVRPAQSFAHAGKVRHAYHRHHSARLAARLATRLSLLQARL